MKVIHDHFAEDKEVYEVAMYIISTLTVDDAVLRAFMTNSTVVAGIPPEAYHLMKRFDNGLTMNDFYHKHFGPIKMQLTLADVKLNTMRHYVEYGEKNNDMNAFSHIKAILLSRIDALTTLAVLWKGVQFGEDFDAKVRIGMMLSKEHEAYFKSKGM